MKGKQIANELLLFENLAALISAGHSLNQAIELMHYYHNLPFLKNIQNQLENGQDFAIAINDFVRPNTVFLVQLAEQHGNLEQTLMMLGKHLRQQASQESKIKQVLRYPILLLGLLAIIFVGLQCFLWPTLSEWTGQQIVLFEINYWFYVGISLGLSLVIFGYWRWHKLSPFQQLLICGKVPIIKKFTKMIVTYQASQIIATLLQAGFSLGASIDYLANTDDKLAQSQICKQLQKKLKQGEDVLLYIEKSPLFEHHFIQYFKRSYQETDLSEQLNYYAKQQFKLLQVEVERLIGWIQPISFAIIGIVIVALYIAMLLPMYQSIGQIYQ